jgi:hypothetical protein
MQIFYSILSIGLVLSWLFCLSSQNIEAIKICGIVWIVVVAMLSILHILGLLDMSGYFLDKY